MYLRQFNATFSGFSRLIYDMWCVWKKNCNQVSLMQMAVLFAVIIRSTANKKSANDLRTDIGNDVDVFLSGLFVFCLNGESHYRLGVTAP